MEKLNDFSKINELIDKIFRNDKYMPDLHILQLKKKWNKIMGDQLMNHTSPYKIYHETLIINCDHQGWINTLQFHKDQILTNINQYFNQKIKINDIKFVYNKKYS